MAGPRLRARDKAETQRELCERIAAGESVAAIFKLGGIGIGERTFWRWIHADKDFLAAYEAATVRRGEKYGEEIAAIADEIPPQIETRYGTKVDPGWVQWQHGRIEARKWVASHLCHKRYGDRTVIAGDAENPLVVDDMRSEILRRLGAESADGTDSVDHRDTLQ